MARVLVALAGLVLVPAAAAQATPLFDGKSLDGWSGDPAVWSVEDGQIVGSTVGRPIRANTFLVWQGGEVEDFELSFQARISGDNNSGVQYRSRLADPKTWRVVGYQADIHPNPPYVGMLYGEGLGRGIIAQRGQNVVIDADGGKPRVIGEVGDGPDSADTPIDVSQYHRYRIVARGPRLVHEVDGVVTVDVTDRHPQALREGIIALQVHAGRPMTAYFKDIVLRRIGGSGAVVVEREQPEPGAANAPAESAVPQWIWDRSAQQGEELWFRRSFEVERGALQRARLFATCDDHLALWINGERVLQSDSWERSVRAGVRRQLRAGRNVIAARCRNDGGPAAFAARLLVERRDGGKHAVVTDPTWRVAAPVDGARDADGGGAWTRAEFDDSGWSPATSHGTVGADGLPWSPQVSAAAFGVRGPPAPPAEPQPARPAASLAVLPEFRAELVYEVPRAQQGSWVSLTTGPDGTLFASDQQSGLYRIRPARIGDATSNTTVERVDVELGGAQGLLWAFDSLYAVVNGPGSGLYRLRDTDGDDRLDDVEKLTALRGSGEHGPHAIILAPDRESLIVMAGNHTELPEISGSRLPANWGEDLLLPRQWDARGHARGRLAPGGWICEVDPEGRWWELICSGFRNQYDIALGPDGELFTYDADMEWDMGMPWYRPTRVCHVVSGGEFGWRSGSGKWPVYYEDSLPPVIELGPGSPTGVVSGRGARFPRRYQEALFVLDWTFGTMYAVHLTPSGASFVGEQEEFVSGQPLALSDAVVGHDGALYFTVGGRNTQSALYRVHWVGDAADTAAADAPAADAPAADAAAADAAAPTGTAAELRALRRSLEAFHGRRDPRAVSTAWPHLAHRDRFVRYAARLAVEAQPVDDWRDRAVRETEPQAAILGLIALARQGDAGVQPAILAALGRLDLGRLPAHQVLAALRAYALAFVRTGAPENAARRALVARLDPLYPSGDDDIDAELARLLVFLDAPSVVEKTLARITAEHRQEPPAWGALIARNANYGGTIQRMLDDMPPVRKLWDAFVLRNVRYGWSLEQRRAYFGFLRAAREHAGGMSYTGFIDRIRDEALENCSDAERTALADLTGAQAEPPAPFEVAPPRGPGRKWTSREALALVAGGLRGRSFESGRNLFHATSCAACHRFDGAGGDLGPDLSNVANRFGFSDLLDAILDPNQAVSDQYASKVVTTTDGASWFGRVFEVEARGGNAAHLEVYTSAPGAPPVKIARSDVRSIEPSELSQMPAGLVDTLNAEELSDLLAYLMSRGNADDPMFRR